MKKSILLLTVFSAIFQISKAQGPKFGITAGGTLADYHSVVDNKSATSNFTPGFSAGVIADFSLGTKLAFQPSLQFLQKGGSESSTSDDENFKFTMHINYLEMPLNFLFKANGKDGGFEFGLGPVLSYGLGGTGKVSSPSGSETESIKFGSDEEFQRAFEFSGNILAGYQWKSGFMVQANYNMGFTNLWNDGGTFKNNYFGLRFGFLFGH